MLKQFIIAITISAATLLPTDASAADPAVVEAFKSAPKTVIPLLPQSKRLDMLDYYNSGLETPSVNLINGNSRITDMTERTISIDLTPASTLQIIALPAANKEYVALISTLATPAPDSKLTIYTDDWKQNVTDRLFRSPEISDWLTAEGRKNADRVEMSLPFMLVSYGFDPATQTLTLTNNSASFLASEVYEEIEPLMLKELVYRWNGKKFEAAK